MQLTTTDFQKLTTESGHNTPVIIRTPDGTTHEIKRIAFEQIHEIVEKEEPATLETGHETIVPHEQSTTRFIIDIL